MAAGPSSWFISSFILLVFVSSAVTYTGYDISSDRVCSRLSKRELSLSMSRPLLVRDSGRLLSRWSGVHSFRCKWEVESKGRGIGIVGVVQLLKFRRLGISDCTDYVQFKEDKENNPGPRLCGTMMFGHYITENGSFIQTSPIMPSPAPPTPPAPSNTALSILSTLFRTHNPWAGLVSRGSAIDPNGELKTTVYVEAKPLRASETLELVIVFSGFQECDGRSVPSTMFHCGYGLCISSSLVNDGIVNCPFGNCIDEKNCTAALASNRTWDMLGIPVRTSHGVSPGVTATSSFFGIAVLVTIAACICFLLRRNRQKRDSPQPEEEPAAYPAQPANGEYVGVPTNTGMQNAEQPSAVPFQQPPPDAAPPIGFCVPQQPAGLPPVGTPYPAATAPMQYPPQPHQYPTVAAPYPVQPVESPPPYTSLFPANKN